MHEFHFVSDDKKFAPEVVAVMSKIYLGVVLVHRNQRLEYLPRIMVNVRLDAQL